MKVFAILLAIFLWIAIWGIFDICTEKYTSNEKLCIYFIMMIFVIIVVFAFPKLLDHIC